MAKKTTTTKSTPGFDAPQSRNEAILQNILGANNVLGEPQSRIEALLMQILEQGGGGAVNSVNGQTGNVVLDAEDVGATPETFLVTVTESNGSYTADKTYAEISAAYAAGKRLMASFPIPFDDLSVNVLNPLVPATYGSYIVAFASYIVMNTAAGVTQHQLAINDNSVEVSASGVQTPFMTATITIATTDWVNGSCTKTVSGMTADALVFVKYSDTETEFAETQGANSMTFTAATTPSEAVTVYVAWLV